MRVYEASISYNLVQLGDDITVNSAPKVVEYMKSAFEVNPVQESFWVILLDRKNHALGRVKVTVGTATASLAHPREVFRPAILANACAIICVHNHPSGDPSPSNPDVQVTCLLREASKTVEIDLIDHVIVGYPDLKPVPLGHDYIGDEQVEVLICKNRDGLSALRHGRHLVPARDETRSERRPKLVGVFGDTGADSSGYINHARLLLEGRLHVAARVVDQYPAGSLNYLYVPLGFKPAPSGEAMVPTYPVGLPLFLAVSSTVFGWSEGPNVTMVVFGVAGLLLTFATGRTFGLSGPWSVVAAIITAASPVAVMMTLITMSDVPAMVSATAAVLAAMRARRSNAHGSGWAMTAGLAYSLAVLIRPTNALVLAPVAVAFGSDWRKWPPFVFGGLPGGIVFCLHSYSAYGRFFTTGYGDGVELSVIHILPTLLHYVKWSPVVFTPAVFGILLLPAAVRRVGRDLAVLAVWMLVFAGFYAAYRWTSADWWYLRFLLPAAPGFVVGGLLGWQAFVARVLPPGWANESIVRISHRIKGATNWSTALSERAFVASLLLLLASAFTLANGVYWAIAKGVVPFAHSQRTHPVVTRWMQRHVPANSVIITLELSGAMFFYTDFAFARWDQFNGSEFTRFTHAVSEAHRPIYAVLLPNEFDEQRVLEKRIPGNWQLVVSIGLARIWKWEGDGAPTSSPGQKNEGTGM